ncbi:MAG: gas vesicle protein GvpG [Deltaproteobacteria bacterium]|nr:gas vesicle protein GvpG [Deltaproteobacteria bacterium]
MGLLTAPFRGLLWVFEEVAEQADQEMYNDDAVRAELTDLYHRLEAGTLSEEEFDRREAELVERLEEIEAHKQGKRGRSRGERR